MQTLRGDDTPQLHTSLQDWLTWIAQLHPKEIELGLERVRCVAEHLGFFPLDLFVVTVGGTNGKGSCVATLEAILQCAGYRVGAYFSPHLHHYNERIRVAGTFVSDMALCEAFSAINQARQGISLSYFEWGTLAALWLFKQAGLDVIILEVGLGGRLDAVNIVDADIAVITTVDLDHTEWLGTDRESIGSEKAGIFRSGKPAICGDFNVPKSVRVAADRIGAPLFCQGVEFGYQCVSALSWQFWCVEAERLQMILPLPYFLPQNVATALMSIMRLKDQFHITDEAIANGIRQAFLPGRFQEISKNPQVIVDVAHNPQSCQQLSNRLQTMPLEGKTYAVVGMMADKDHRESLKSLLPIIDHWFVADLESHRSCPTSQLIEAIPSLNVKQFGSILEAYKEALNSVRINDRIVVFGSFYAVDPILKEV